MQFNQRLYLLSLLQSSGLQPSSLHLLFSALVINKLTYALRAYAGQLIADDKTGLMLYQERPYDVDSTGLTLTILRLTLTPSLTSQIANSIGRPLNQVTACTISSLLKPPLPVLISFVRGNNVQHSQFKNS